MDKARETSLTALMEIETKGAYSNLVLKKVLRSNSLDTRDRAFITELVYGTITRKLTLDWIISRFSKIKPAKLSRWVLLILRLGIYQIMYLDRIPQSAACNTSVSLAKKYEKASGGFVNAVLRNICRGKDGIKFPDSTEGSLAKNMSIRYSFPEYLAEAWIAEYGEEFTQELLKSLLERPEFTVRANTLKTSREELIEELLEEGIESVPGRVCDEALFLRNVSDISQTKAYIDGMIIVQDESSMLVTKVLDPKPGERILDVCSAPGGKATHIGQYMKNEGEIVAWDIHEHKTQLIRENAARLGIKNIEVEQRDALLPAEEIKGRFNRVLVDAPCSGTGIIRRKPDIKWHRKPDDFGSLVEIQRKILYNASRAVTLGGILVYSTCSLDNRENSHVIRAFLSENSDFTVEPLIGCLPGGINGKKDINHGMLNLFPHIDGTDGFFIARLRRNEG